MCLANLSLYGVTKTGHDRRPESKSDKNVVCCSHLVPRWEYTLKSCVGSGERLNSPNGLSSYWAHSADVESEAPASKANASSGPREPLLIEVLPLRSVHSMPGGP